MTSRVKAGAILACAAAAALSLKQLPQKEASPDRASSSITSPSHLSATAKDVLFHLSALEKNTKAAGFFEAMAAIPELQDGLEGSLSPKTLEDFQTLVTRFEADESFRQAVREVGDPEACQDASEAPLESARAPLPADAQEPGCAASEEKADLLAPTVQSPEPDFLQ